MREDEFQIALRFFLLAPRAKQISCSDAIFKSANKIYETRFKQKLRLKFH